MGMEFEGRRIVSHIAREVGEVDGSRIEFPEGIIFGVWVLPFCGEEGAFQWSNTREELAASGGEITLPLKPNDHYTIEYTGDGHTKFKKEERREEDGMGE